MPLGNDGRARRPMPRQLDMSDWSGDSSSTTRDNDYVRSASGVSREADDIKMREPSNRFDSFRDNEYRPRRSSAREESQRSYEGRGSRSSAFDMSSFSSERSTIRSDAFDTRFTSSRDFTRGGSAIPTYRSDRHNNQREIDDFSGGDRFGSARSQQDERWRSNRTSHDSLRRTSDDFTGSSSYTGTGDSFSSRISFGYGRSNHHAESSILGDKADSIREAESPRRAAAVKGSRNEDGERTRPEIKTSSVASGFDNQDEHRSPTNSGTSTPPVSPDYDGDSVAQRIQNRYPKSSIPSPVSSDRSTTRRMRPSSPCSSVSTIRTSTSKGSTTKTKHSDTNERVAQCKMSDLREDLYSFRKQMREVFIRVEDMVDVHRSLFKSDPSTGSPIFNGELQQEAEKLANEAFEQLADLRKHFTRLAKDFQRSEHPTDNWSASNRSRRTRDSEVPRRHKTQQPSIHTSDHDNNSIKGSDIPEDDCSDHLSVASDNNDEASTREHSPSIRTSSHVDSDDDVPTATMPDSVRSTSSTYLSSQLQSRWRKNSSAESIANSDISARTRDRSSSIVSAVSSLPDQCSKASESDTDIFKDFDKRMEEIRCSLNAIASGKNPHRNNVAVSPKNFTTGGAGSPIRAMMDATRTRPTPRISSQDNDGRPRPDARDTELRQLLQELNNINANNGDDV